MIHTHQTLPLLCVFALAATSICAQSKEDDARSEKLANTNLRTNEPLNRFKLSYRVGFNLSARFKGMGGFPLRNNPGPAAPTSGDGPHQLINHSYDDGHNLVDSHDNNHNEAPYDHATWFWDYRDAGQLSGNILSLHSDSSAASGSSKDIEDNPHHGMELSYDRQLGHIGQARWGIEAALGYTDLSFTDNKTYAGGIQRITDQYQLLSTDPYDPGLYIDPNDTQGNGPRTFNGPGPFISDLLAAKRSFGIDPNATAQISGKRHLTANLFTGRLGPYVEIPVSKRVSVSLSGGLALVNVDSKFNFDETVTVTGLGTDRNVGSGSHSDLKLGGYFSGTITVAVCRHADLFASVQFQSAGTYSHSVVGNSFAVDQGNKFIGHTAKSADIDLGKTIFFSLGIAIPF